MKQKPEVILEQIAQWITYHPKQRMQRFRELSLSKRSAVFNILSPHVRQEILERLSLDESVELLDHLDLRRAHHILGHMENIRRRRRIIKRLKNDLHAKVERFLQFHPKASFSLFHLDYVLLDGSTTIGETASIIEDYLRHTGKIPEVFVSRNGEMVGEVSFASLVREQNSSKLQEYVRPIKTIVYTAPRQEIITLFTSRPHQKAAVLDSDGSLLGVVYSDDVLELFSKSPATMLYNFAGVVEDERPFDSVRDKISHRYRWLILNLITAFLAAAVVAIFEDTLARIVLLAVCMPIIAGMGGNAATQTLAVMVRGIALGEVTLKNSKPVIFREVVAGFVNGIIIGALTALAAILFNQSPLFGLVVGISVIANLVVAGFFGALIPLLLKYVGKDPATSATIFITTATDMFGFFALLGLATLILL